MENKDIKLARQCLQFKGIKCDNKSCLNTSCPLNKEYDLLSTKNEVINEVFDSIERISRFCKDDSIFRGELNMYLNKLKQENKSKGCGKQVYPNDTIKCGQWSMGDQHFCNECFIKADKGVKQDE